MSAEIVSTQNVNTEIMVHIKNGINEEHRLAQQSAVDAVKHAIACGDLLIKLKSNLKHGDFGKWIVANCEFKQSTATRYMRAATQSATGVAISSLRQLFPSGRSAVSLRRDREGDDGLHDNHDDDSGHRQEHHYDDDDDDHHHEGHGDATQTEPLKHLTARDYPRWRTRRQKILEIERAIKSLSSLADQQQILNRYQDCRNEVTRLQNRLIDAEGYLFNAEVLLSWPRAICRKLSQYGRAREHRPRAPQRPWCASAL